MTANSAMRPTGPGMPFQPRGEGRAVSGSGIFGTVAVVLTTLIGAILFVAALVVITALFLAAVLTAICVVAIRGAFHFLPQGPEGHRVDRGRVSPRRRDQTTAKESGVRRRSHGFERVPSSTQQAIKRSATTRTPDIGGNEFRPSLMPQSLDIAGELYAGSARCGSPTPNNEQELFRSSTDHATDVLAWLAVTIFSPRDCEVKSPPVTPIASCTRSSSLRNPRAHPAQPVTR